MIDRWVVACLLTFLLIFNTDSAIALLDRIGQKTRINNPHTARPFSPEIDILSLQLLVLNALPTKVPYITTYQ